MMPEGCVSKGWISKQICKFKKQVVMDKLMCSCGFALPSSGNILKGIFCVKVVDTNTKHCLVSRWYFLNKNFRQPNIPKFQCVKTKVFPAKTICVTYTLIYQLLLWVQIVSSSKQWTSQECEGNLGSMDSEDWRIFCCAKLISSKFPGSF